MNAIRMRIKIFRIVTTWLKDGEPFMPTDEEKLLTAVYGLPQGVSRESSRMQIGEWTVRTKAEFVQIWDHQDEADILEIEII